MIVLVATITRTSEIQANQFLMFFQVASCTFMRIHYSPSACNSDSEHVNETSACSMPQSKHFRITNVVRRFLHALPPGRPGRSSSLWVVLLLRCKFLVLILLPPLISCSSLHWKCTYIIFCFSSPGGSKFFHFRKKKKKFDLVSELMHACT